MASLTACRGSERRGRRLSEGCGRTLHLVADLERLPIPARQQKQKLISVIHHSTDWDRRWIISPLCPSPECHSTRQTACRRVVMEWKWQKWECRGCRWHGHARRRYPECSRPRCSSARPLSRLQLAPVLVLVPLQQAHPRHLTPCCLCRGLWGPSSVLRGRWSQHESKIMNIKNEILK